MTPDCYPISALPNVTRLYADYLALGGPEQKPIVSGWYGAAPVGDAWMFTGGGVATRDADALADALRRQAVEYDAGEAVLANVERLRKGARAVVTGQQVALFGGPLLTLLKAATAIARAAQAEAATGVPHVPVFWLATEDHDLAEADQAAFPNKRELETLRLGLAATGVEAGSVPLGANVDALLDQVRELTAYAPVCDLLASAYRPERTLGQAFARWMTALFSSHGLVVMDASGRDFHTLGRDVLRAAIVRAEELEAALLERSAALTRGGYHAQVLVKPGASLLFLIDEQTSERQALRRAGGEWKAGRQTYTTAQMLAILEHAPERLSPNALLRPVFQDRILPTAAYIGGPAEIAYFAQSAVLYDLIAGHRTPVLPRFSATLVQPEIRKLMDRHELQLTDVIAAGSVDNLTQRLGARSMPIETKRRLAATGNSLDEELGALTSYMAAMDESLGRSAAVSASKMRYQMNRLRRMAATFEVQKQTSLRKQAETLRLNLFPDGHLQERVLAGAWFLAACGEELVDRLVEQAAQRCPGHMLVQL